MDSTSLSLIISNNLFLQGHRSIHFEKCHGKTRLNTNKVTTIFCLCTWFTGCFPALPGYFNSDAPSVIKPPVPCVTGTWRKEWDEHHEIGDLLDADLEADKPPGSPLHSTLSTLESVKWQIGIPKQNHANRTISLWLNWSMTITGGGTDLQSDHVRCFLLLVLNVNTQSGAFASIKVAWELLFFYVNDPVFMAIEACTV